MVSTGKAIGYLIGLVALGGAAYLGIKYLMTPKAQNPNGSTTPIVPVKNPVIGDSYYVQTFSVAPPNTPSQASWMYLIYEKYNGPGKIWTYWTAAPTGAPNVAGEYLTVIAVIAAIQTANGLPVHIPIV
jgi:hypothetical protein